MMKLTDTQANAILAAGIRPVRRNLSGFAEACYNSNTADDLIGFVTSTADATDCEEWGLSADEWRNAQREALELALANWENSRS